FLAKELSDYLNRTGSLIAILTLMFFAIIISTQFSFGRFFAVLIAAVKSVAIRGIDSFHGWREERRREQQRREVIAKHTKKGIELPASATAPAPKPAKKQPDEVADVPGRPPIFGALKSLAPAKPPKVTMPP